MQCPHLLFRHQQRRTKVGEHRTSEICISALRTGGNTSGRVSQTGREGLRSRCFGGGGGTGQEGGRLDNEAQRKQLAAYLFNRLASFASVMFASFASISSFCMCAASSGDTSSSSSSSIFRFVLRETAALAAFPSAACRMTRKCYRPSTILSPISKRKRKVSGSGVDPGGGGGGADLLCSPPGHLQLGLLCLRQASRRCLQLRNNVWTRRASGASGHCTHSSMDIDCRPLPQIVRPHNLPGSCTLFGNPGAHLPGHRGAAWRFADLEEGEVH